MRILRSYEPGETVALQVLRKREKLTITVPAPRHGPGSFQWRGEPPEPPARPGSAGGSGRPSGARHAGRQALVARPQHEEALAATSRAPLRLFPANSESHLDRQVLVLGVLVPLLLERERGHVRHAVEKDDAVEVIVLVLDDPGVETVPPRP